MGGRHAGRRRNGAGRWVCVIYGGTRMACFPAGVKEAPMSENPDWVYIYRATTGSTSVPAGVTEMRVLWSLDARRRRRKALSLESLRDGTSLTNEIRYGNTFLWMH